MKAALVLNSGALRSRRKAQVFSNVALGAQIADDEYRWA